jgi:hypothetical protein
MFLKLRNDCSGEELALHKAHFFLWAIIVQISVEYFCQQNENVLFCLNLIIAEIAHDEVVHLVPQCFTAEVEDSNRHHHLLCISQQINVAT